MSRRLVVSISALALLLLRPVGAAAQEYLFGVDKETVDVSWNADGSQALEYTFVFTNQPGAHAIDFVDVGMPTSTFDMSTASADVAGNPIGVSQGDYAGSGTGFSAVLGSSAIQPGKTGSVRVRIGRVTGVLHPDSSDSSYTSAVFAPTYFASKYVVGGTDLQVTFHLPPGIKPEESRYHMAENWPGSPQPVAALDDQGRITYTWSAPNATATRQYVFGASFPKSYVPAGAIVTPQPIDLTSVFTTIMGMLVPVACIGIFVLIFVGMPIMGIIQGQRRKLQYLPPRITIEGHGIKRGLTAVEAAILLEEPLDKVLTMTLFGVVKKGAATVVARDPVTIQAADPVPAGLNAYETSFLAAFKTKDAANRERELENMVVALVKSVSEKMKGFSRQETVDYYKNIMRQAWAQVEAAQTPEVKGQKIDQNLEWTMLDRDYADRSRRLFTGPIYTPMWWGHYDPSWRPSSAGSASTSAGSGAPLTRGSSTLPGADMAASVVGGVQSFSGKVIGDLNSFTSRITNVTNPPPAPSTSTYRGGGGHSCACACACAGCACACAGGGR
jgi:hypothetical protein